MRKYNEEAQRVYLEEGTTKDGVIPSVKGVIVPSPLTRAVKGVELGNAKGDNGKGENIEGFKRSSINRQCKKQISNEKILTRRGMIIFLLFSWRFHN
jgi:hypothetical protein